MNATIFLALFFAVLLGLERRYRLGGVRVGTALFALVVLFFAKPSSTRAARWAIVAPPTERVTQLGYPLSEYESGVATMKQAMEEDWHMGANARLLAVGVLFWLACTPVLWGLPRPSLRESEGTSRREFRDDGAIAEKNA